MNWLNLITLILQTEAADLPAIEALIEGIKGATPQHQTMVNKAVSAALSAKAKLASGPLSRS